MKELFTGFLSVSLSGSLILCLVILLRLVFKRVPKAFFCILWVLAMIRMLLPFQIETSFSLRPDTPVFSVADPYRTEESVEKVVEVTSNTLQLPVQYSPINDVDYWQIAAWVWAAGVLAMLAYTLISYLQLKHRLRDAVLIENGIYASEKLNSAILLGYIFPCIYLPTDIFDQDTELVIAHECAHLRRGDNWLKLFGFVCLAVHWFNPLAWVAYVLLCRDVEDACDEQVIRDLDTEGKKRYSAALLSCGTQKKTLSVCPVAFGEIGIRQRILNVLSYRKPTLWVCIVAIIAIAVTTVFFMTDPVQEHPPFYDMMAELLGQPLDAVCDGLDISRDELTPMDEYGYNYETPIRVTYQGIPFQLNIYTGRPDYLYAFEYVAYYDAFDTQTEADIVTLARHHWKAFGEGYQAKVHKDADILSYISKKTIRRTIDANIDEGVGTRILQDEWDLTQSSSAAVKRQLASIKETGEWKAVQQNLDLREDGVTRTYEPHLFLSFYAYYDTLNTFEDVVIVKLHYRVRYHMDAIPTYVAGFVEKQTWWDKFLYWLK